MAFFGKKKNTDAQNSEAAENKESNNVTEEMKIILAAREEEKQERQARAEERQQAQEEADKKEDLNEENARKAAERVLSGNTIPTGMNFFLLCDEIPMTAAPEKEGNIIVRGNLRGTVKRDSEVYLYQGRGKKFTVRIEKIRNDNRVFVDEASYERVELEITRGDIPLPQNPEDDSSRPIQRYAVITDAKGIEDMDDPACKGMAIAGNPRTITMLCEYGKYSKDPVFFGTTMDCLMTSEFVTLAKITGSKNGKSTVAFMGLSVKTNPGVPFLPVFTDQRLARIAAKNGFGNKGGGPDQTFIMSFAQVAKISRDQFHQGFIVNPGGPVTITIPKDLVDKMIETTIYRERFGSEEGNMNPDNVIAGGGSDVPGAKKLLVTDPSGTPEFSAVGNAVRKYCGAHSDIARAMILITAPADNRKDRSYICIMDCSEESFEKECKGLAEAIRPYLKGVKGIRFQLFSKMNKEGFPSDVKWLYSKLPQ